MKIVLCYSGGLDSTVLLYHLIAQGHKVSCLHFAYGSRHQEAEGRAAIEICADLGVSLKVVDLAFVGEIFSSALLSGQGELPSGHQHDPIMKATVVPGRNTIFASIGLGYAESIGASQLALAIHADDQPIYPDTSSEWAAAMSVLVDVASAHKVSVVTPFVDKYRVDICRLGAQLQVPFDRTWTCYAGGNEPCGRCGACCERHEAMVQAGL